MTSKKEYNITPGAYTLSTSANKSTISTSISNKTVYLVPGTEFIFWVSSSSKERTITSQHMLSYWERFKKLITDAISVTGVIEK
jgi:hypothetical protein